MAQFKGKQLADAPNGVSTGKINDSAVSALKLAADSVTTVKILDANVTAAKLATDSVTTAKIVDANVTAAKLATDSVTTAKILDANVTTSKLAAGVLSADAAGRAKIATGFFDAATVSDKFAAASIALSKLAEAVIQADGGQAFTADQSMGGFKLTNVATPTAGTDATNKDYVDNLAAGLSWKDSVRCATTGNITLSGLQTIDGITVAAGERVLVKAQTTASENGIYLAASGAWTRTTDADAADELDGAAAFVEEGTVAANTMWTQTGDGGTFAVNSVWVQFAATVSLTAGAGLLDTGGTWSVELATDPGLEFDAGGDSGRLRVKVLSTGSITRLSSGLAVLLDGSSLTSTASGLKAAVPVSANKDQSPTAGTGNEQTTGLTIAATPSGDAYVRVSVNGIGYRLGDGVKTKDCYFSADAGVTARAIAAIENGDTLYWNGTVVGFNLETSDSVDMEYGV